ncbi:MAG: DNA ligase D [Polyangiaceae bacterium]|nr:DNA ligase D [Polyangiaceae bacterium]
MKLDEYRRIRDESRTPEPFGRDPARAPRAPGGTREGAYVVHLHDARRRHYDLRFEVGGALASFAIPRGPSLDPGDRRLAVRTEDHPLEYLDFEAVIPAGNYGAGAMILWDRGRVRYTGQTAEEGLARGKIDLELGGQKLRGLYTLVRTRRAGADGQATEWLLIKKPDAFSSTDRDILAESPRSVLSGLTVDELGDAPRIAQALEETAATLGAPLRAPGRPAPVAPMLCALRDASPAGPGWIHELKLDGVRLIATKEPPGPGAAPGSRAARSVSLTGRRRTDITGTYPEIARAVEALAARRAVLDGEIVALDDQGQPSFQRLARRIHLQRDADVRLAALEVPVLYVVFDLLAIGDRDLRPLPLFARKELLRRLVPAPGIVRALDYVEEDGEALLAFCRARHLEGIVAKRRLSPYREGARVDDWVKVKCERDDDFVIVGWTRGEGARERLGALDLASYDGGRLIYRGKVGSGLDEPSIDTVLSRLAPLTARRPAAEGLYVRAPRGRTHVRPEAVVSVRHHGFTDDGQVLHAVFRGLRDDIPPTECTAGPKPGATEIAQAEVEPPADQGPESGVRAVALPRVEPARPAPARVTITHRDKVLWPDDGYTKADLCAYYEAVAPVMLPYLADRPVMLVRYPDGIRGKHFYAWNVPPGLPSWIRRLDLEDEDRGDINEVFLVDHADTLVYIANLGAIPIHVPAGRAQSLDFADFLTMDLDVKPSSSLEAAVATAQDLHEILDAIGLPGFPKTSGQSGLHVLVPLGPGVRHEAAHTLAELLGRMLVQRRPAGATMARSPASRGNRLFVDTGQTGRWRTIVAPYSLRAVPGALASAPLEWDEVEPGLDLSRYDLRTMPARIAGRGDPMAPLLKLRPDLPAAVDRLEALVRLGARP